MRFLGLLEHPSIFIYLIVNKIVRRVVAETFMGLICVCVILATWSAPAPSGPRTTLLLLLTLAQVRDLDYHWDRQVDVKEELCAREVGGEI